MSQGLAWNALFCYHRIVDCALGLSTTGKRGTEQPPMAASSRTDKQDRATLKKLLGSLELEVMELLWQAGEATVRQIAERINRDRPVAYTTVMTVMGHLVTKGLLTRVMEQKRYRYRIVNTQEDFLREACRTKVRSLLDDYGDLAIAGFLGEIDNVDSDRLDQLRRITQEASSGRGTPR